MLLCDQIAHCTDGADESLSAGCPSSSTGTIRRPVLDTLLTDLKWHSTYRIQIGLSGKGSHPIDSLRDSFIHSFIHIKHLYSTSSRNYSEVLPTPACLNHALKEQCMIETYIGNRRTSTFTIRLLHLTCCLLNWSGLLHWSQHAPRCLCA